MRPTLINYEQVDVVEKIVAGMSEREVLTHYEARLVDKDTGEPIISEETGEASTIRYSWEPVYVPEAFATVVDTFLLSEHVQLVCPIENDAAIIPPHSTLVPASSEFLTAVVPVPEKDSGALDLRFLEWLDEGRNDSVTMFARAYNGQYDDVALRLGPSDFAAMQRGINDFNADAGDEERFESGVLRSSVIFRAYDELTAEYRIRVGELFKNQADVILPPLASTLLDRLPERPGPEAFLDRLMVLRSELAPVRRRFVEFQQIDDDPDRSIADAEKVMRAIEADAHHFARKWNQNVTDNALVQFCIDNLSFLVKLIVKTRHVEPGEVAERVARVCPALERRLRSSAPTILSTYALKSRRIRSISRQFDAKFGLRFE